MRFLILTVLLAVSFLSSCQSHTESPKNKGVAEGAAPTAASFQNIDQAEFLKKQSEGAVIIDVRTPGEIADGYIKGATIFADVNGSDFATKVEALDKSKTYLVYCRSGKRSSTAAHMMVEKGFTNVFNLNGGILGWTSETAK